MRLKTLFQALLLRKYLIAIAVRCVTLSAATDCIYIPGPPLLGIPTSAPGCSCIGIDSRYLVCCRLQTERVLAAFRKPSVYNRGIVSGGRIPSPGSKIIGTSLTQWMPWTLTLPNAYVSACRCIF